MKNNTFTSDGRKYKLALIIMLAMLAGFGIASFNPVLVKLYSELLTGLAMVYFTYCGGNVGNKWVSKKKIKSNIPNDSMPLIKGEL